MKSSEIILAKLRSYGLDIELLWGQGYDGRGLGVEDDVSGASLNGKGPIELTISQLKRWLQCWGVSTKGKKARKDRICKVILILDSELYNVVGAECGWLLVWLVYRRNEILLKGKASSLVTFDPRSQEHCKLGKEVIEEFHCDLLVLNQSSASLFHLWTKLNHDHLYSKSLLSEWQSRGRGHSITPIRKYICNRFTMFKFNPYRTIVMHSWHTDVTIHDTYVSVNKTIVTNPWHHTVITRLHFLAGSLWTWRKSAEASVATAPDIFQMEIVKKIRWWH